MTVCETGIAYYHIMGLIKSLEANNKPQKMSEPRIIPPPASDELRVNVG